MARMLAHVEKVSQIRSIPKADNLEVAQVLGWECVIKKDANLKVGDLCIYIEIDSIVPDWPIFDFLASRKFRVRTIKLRGQISQGLALPIDDTILVAMKLKRSDIKEGMDLTEHLQIKKHDLQEEAERRAQEVFVARVQRSKKNWFVFFLMKFAFFRWIYFKFNRKETFPWPAWIQKTDETRVQAAPGKFLIAGNDYYTTEKVDGQSGTYFVQKGSGWFAKPEYGMCSRNYRLVPGSGGSWPIIYDRIKTNMFEAFKKYPNGFFIQGEIIGPGIQGNKYRRNDLEFYVFNVGEITATGTRKFSLHEMEQFCKEFGFVTVPILDRAFTNKTELNEMLEYAKGYSVLKDATDVRREGVVIRKLDQSISFKAINNDFLLHEVDDPEEFERQNKPPQKTA